jgi:hypothetical protein
MLKSDQQEKVLTKTTNLLRHKQSGNTQFKSTMNTNDPPQKPKSAVPTPTSTKRDPPQKPKSDGSHQQQHTNHRITKDPFQKQTSDGPKLNPNVHLVHLRNKMSDGSETDINQTQVFFPGSDFIL